MDTLALTSTTPRNPHASRNIAETMLSRGFAETNIDTSILAQHIAPIRDGMRRLTSSDEALQLFPHKVIAIDEMGWDQEVGLIRRTGGVAPKKIEEKFFFHYIPRANWSEEEMGGRDFREFVESCDAINTAAKKIALALASEIDAIHSDESAERREFAAQMKDAHCVTRVLRYLERPAEEKSADAFTHIDRGAITVHWWSSHPGLVVFDRNGQPHRVAENEWDKIAVFAGKKFGGFFGGRYGFGTPHGVRDPRRATGVRDGDRFAIVSFVHVRLAPEMVEWMHARKADIKAFEDSHAL